LEENKKEDRKRKAEFLKFLKERRISKSKELKKKGTYYEESDFLKEESVERWKTLVLQEQLKQFDSNPDPDDDFIHSKEHEASEEQCTYDEYRQNIVNEEFDNFNK